VYEGGGGTSHGGGINKEGQWSHLNTNKFFSEQNHPPMRQAKKILAAVETKLISSSQVCRPQPPLVICTRGRHSNGRLSSGYLLYNFSSSANFSALAFPVSDGGGRLEECNAENSCSNDATQSLLLLPIIPKSRPLHTKLSLYACSFVSCSDTFPRHRTHTHENCHNLCEQERDDINKTGTRHKLHVKTGGLSYEHLQQLLPGLGR
jgi:hypothetical protein